MHINSQQRREDGVLLLLRVNLIFIYISFLQLCTNVNTVACLVFQTINSVKSDIYFCAALEQRFTVKVAI